MEPFYYKEKYKSLSLVPGRSLGAQRGSGAGQGPCEQREELQRLHIPLAGKCFGRSILQPGVELEQGAAPRGSHWHPGVHGAQALHGWKGRSFPGFMLRQQDSAPALSFVFVTRLNFHPKLFSRAAALVFLLRNVDLFGWMLDRWTEICASECSKPTFRNMARSSCHY